jgi:D-alanyl-D-alanine carboxypeptidase (penicillin-binding protein 5/6)
MGQAVGSLKIMAGDSDAVLAEVPLQVLEAVGEAGIFRRAWDAVRLWIK